MSRNTALTELCCYTNHFTAAGLNALFGTLYSNGVVNKTIFIKDNLGADSCDKSIATGKGWTVDTTYPDWY